MDKANKLYIFDMDGTLVDSEKQAELAYVLTMQSLGYDPILFPYNNCIGKEFSQWSENLFKVYGSSFQIDLFFSSFISKCKELPIEPTLGAKEILMFLQKIKARCCLATANSKKTTISILKTLDFENFFDSIFTRDDVKYSKPDPEVYQLAVQHFNEDPKNCYAIEDSFVGALAAQKANIPSILIPCYSMDTSERRQLIPLKEFCSLLDFLEWLSVTKGAL